MGHDAGTLVPGIQPWDQTRSALQQMDFERMSEVVLVTPSAEAAAAAAARNPDAMLLPQKPALDVVAVVAAVSTAVATRCSNAGNQQPNLGADLPVAEALSAAAERNVGVEHGVGDVEGRVQLGRRRILGQGSLRLRSEQI